MYPYNRGVSERYQRLLNRRFLSASKYITPTPLLPHDPRPKATAITRENLGKGKLPWETLAADADADSLVLSISHEGKSHYVCKPHSAKVIIDFSHEVPNSYWDFRATYPAVIQRPNKEEVRVQVRSYHLIDSPDMYQCISQQSYYTAVMLDLFKNKMTSFSSKLTVPELRMIPTVWMSENHVLVQGDRSFTLQEEISHDSLTTTSDIDYLPPQHEGNNTLVDFLYAFTHFNYEHHKGTAVIHGFRASGNVIFECVMVDKKSVIVLQMIHPEDCSP
ncbi:uncharacterized protein MELLADRAFT_69126 [Melampsora larici-populina 98AG31]|uniref:Alpha-type protein kinase domain-containing protein n=1 Tax=Melampsora larici-populina (strain 98AG31 / pathotype 3-4-7) TaxID=747676 RepID=F4S9H3_MELLP|nr:uncharacterized protein MELLADRAFT_69126 [Melampsora larici-populina 98AG31]EGF98725.1 hypothetical protein MELLADRAFT_69126 [Melampsora larici-populina 98AG31]